MNAISRIEPRTAAVSYERITLLELEREAGHLFTQNWREIGLSPNGAAFSINRAQYLAMHHLDAARVFVARRGRLVVGYAIYLLAPHPRLLSVVAAISDVVWVMPSERRGWTGIGLLQFAEKGLKEAGVGIVQTTVRMDDPCAKLVLRFLRYQPVELGFIKVLNPAVETV